MGGKGSSAATPAPTQSNNSIEMLMPLMTMLAQQQQQTPTSVPQVMPQVPSTPEMPAITEREAIDWNAAEDKLKLAAQAQQAGARQRHTGRRDTVKASLLDSDTYGDKPKELGE